MTVSEDKICRVVEILRRMGARRVLLFGSFLEDPERARDLDVAVDGIPLDRLLDADVAVHDILQAPSDLVSREENPAFFGIIEKRARVLFEKG